MKLLHGVGILDPGIFEAHIDGKQTREYRLWQAMLSRCYNPSLHIKYPTYLGCSVSPGFRSFQTFAAWCRMQKGYNEQGWKLDKDIIGDGKKYSESTCCFVPNILNTAFIKPYSSYFNADRGLYEVRISKLGKTTYIGSFESEDEARIAYSAAKSNYLDLLLRHFRDRLDERVFTKMAVTYQHNIADAINA